MNLVLGGVGTCMAFFGIFMNLYVIIVLLLNKKARTSSEWILLHLSWCGLGASFVNLCLISPSIFMSRWLTSTGSFCSVAGASVLTIQLLIVWSICALSVDRCAAIASPLRYTQLVTGRRVVIFFLILWVLSVGTAMSAFIVSSMRDEQSVNAGDNNRLSTIRENSGINESNSIAASSSTSLVNNVNAISPSSTIRSSSPSSSSLPDFLMYSSTNLKASTDSIYSSVPSVSIPLSSTTDAEFNPGSNSSFSSPTVANMIFEHEKSSTTNDGEENDFDNKIYSDTAPNINYVPSLVSSQNVKINNNNNSKSNNSFGQVGNESFNTIVEFRQTMGLCLPRVYYTSLPSVLWLSEWIFVVLLAPLCTILVCDLVVLSIARKQRHRIVMALYQITLSAQATVVRSKGATPPQLWLNRSIPARSRACRAVLEDFSSIMLIHFPIILILVFEMVLDDHHAPVVLHYLGSISLFLSPSFTALLYGIRARSLRAAYKSYVRKRMTNNTLQHEIQQRLSPVDGGSPRPSSGAKSFRSCTPSPASSPIQTPRRLSTNDLRPPPMHFPMSTTPLLPFPSASTINTQTNKSLPSASIIVNKNPDSQLDQNNINHDAIHVNNHSNDNGCLGSALGKPRKIRSFLNLPTQYDMQEFWSGLRRPNRSPTIIITHEIRLKDSASSSYESKSIVSSPTAEQRL